MRRPATRLTLLVPIVTLAAIACGEESRSPTGPGETGLSAVEAATASLQFSQVSSGGHHTCGVALDGRAYCWGINFVGQLGDGTTGTTRNRPTAVATSFVSVRSARVRPTPAR